MQLTQEVSYKIGLGPQTFSVNLGLDPPLKIIVILVVTGIQDGVSLMCFMQTCIYSCWWEDWSRFAVDDVDVFLGQLKGYRCIFRYWLFQSSRKVARCNKSTIPKEGESCVFVGQHLTVISKYCKILIWVGMKSMTHDYHILDVLWPWGGGAPFVKLQTTPNLESCCLMLEDKAATTSLLGTQMLKFAQDQGPFLPMWMLFAPKIRWLLGENQ